MINAIVVLLVIAVVGLGILLIGTRDSLKNEIEWRADNNEKRDNMIKVLRKDLQINGVLPKWISSHGGFSTYADPISIFDLLRDIDLLIDHLNLEVSDEPAKTVLREKGAE